MIWPSGVNAVLKASRQGRPCDQPWVCLWKTLGQWEGVGRFTPRAIENQPGIFRSVLNHGFACANSNNGRRQLPTFQAIGIPETGFCISTRHWFRHLGNYVEGHSDCPKQLRSTLITLGIFQPGSYLRVAGAVGKVDRRLSGVIALEPKICTGIYQPRQCLWELGSGIRQSLMLCGNRINPGIYKKLITIVRWYCNLGQWDSSSRFFKGYWDRSGL